MNNNTTILLITLCVLLSIALGFFIYKTNVHEEITIRGHVIEVPIDIPPVVINVKGKPYPVKDTTAYQHYLDSMFALGYSQKDTVIKKTSEPFGDSGKYGRVSYNIVAYPDLAHRSIESIFDIDPFIVDTVLADTTSIVTIENNNYLLAVISAIIAYILAKVF